MKRKAVHFVSLPTLSPDTGAPLENPENIALFKEAIFAGRWLPVVPCWRAALF